MSTRSKIEPIATEAYALAKYLHEMISQGLDREAVLARLSDPADVGAGMLDRAAARRKDGADYLGRGDDFVLIHVADDA
ncbi:MAG: hypothetical protein VYA51_12745 [Planctomycetota bacterium]|nr:hypothetical protein [Planctomycetota bacterium]